MTDCAFPRFITYLLLLNASIFFVMFMNFYVENYRKAKAKVVGSTVKLAPELEKNNNNLDDLIARRDSKKVQ